MGIWNRHYAIAGLLVLTTACGRAKFDKVGTDSALRSQSCPLLDVTVPVKMLFIVDTSGSNVLPTRDNGTVACNSFMSGCMPPTDPAKALRGGAINKFLNQFKDKANFSWSFASFGNGSAKSYVTESGVPGFSTANTMQAAISSFMNSQDVGDTPYRKALSLAKSTIGGDSGLALSGTDSPLYYVVFFSDGYPTDGVTDRDLSDLIAIAPERVKFSTVYYGTQHDPSAAAQLEKMAVNGDGQFVDVTLATNPQLNIEDLIQVQDANCGFKASN